MADEEIDPADDDPPAAPAPPAKKKRKKGGKGAKSKGGIAGKIIIICSALVVVLALIGGISYYLGVVHMLMGWEQPQTQAELDLGKPVYHSLPQIRTDLKTNECRAPFIRATVDVQLAPGDLGRLKDAQDQVMDAILTHLRGQERQHMVGKEGSERLRFELVQIIDNIIQPARVQTILFKELVLQ